MSTASERLDLGNRIRAGETDFSGQRLHDLEAGELILEPPVTFEGADLRCAHLVRLNVMPEMLRGADLRLAHIKTASPLHRRLPQLEAVGARLLSRRDVGRELHTLAETDLGRLRRIAEALTEGRLSDALVWAPRDSVLTVALAAAMEPEPNPILRDLTYEARRVGGLPRLPQFMSPRLRAQTGMSSYGD